MKLIIDSGSTKTQWYGISNAENPTIKFQTRGYNPYYCTTDEILKSLENDLVPILNTEHITALVFYGAGCSSFVNCEIVKEGISEIFDTADVIVDHDMLGAVKALCGDDEGIACILGSDVDENQQKTTFMRKFTEIVPVGR